MAKGDKYYMSCLPPCRTLLYNSKKPPAFKVIVCPNCRREQRVSADSVRVPAPKPVETETTPAPVPVSAEKTS